ncbi:uncharacterized protein A1O9_08799 [Exophiala aquamarina CBS 119918]|uniref:Uncharacterized protein n=1 Tax=Exophiala aquamarina CBS 119918 TaxID=1182545 RepID=A0A072PHZ1_9EURO|nr:uncharacterized protein A1O9_08799 [Exophiala aquamarina CBS 119918]KEF55145.1 hypothetical protein A1O9_08799 [Exophiala aquamarina CBS 119918]
MPSPNHRTRASLGTPSTSAALRRGEVKISDPIPFDTTDYYTAYNTATPSKYPSGLRVDDSTWPRKSSPGTEFHYRHASTGNVPSHTARASAGPSLMPSSMSSIPSKASLSQKKQSGFRAALKRMFSSKKHRSVPADVSDPRYFRSETAYLNPVMEQRTVTRAESIPALRSHAHSTAFGPTHTHQYSDTAGEHTIEPPPRRGRRNTLPSLVFSDRESGLVPAISEWSAGDSQPDKKWVKEDYVSDGQLKRRSRSADALSELLRQGGVDPTSKRDRASEIAYWRNSAIQNPVPVFSGQTISVDPVHVPQTVASIDDSEPASSVVNPLQTFDFGLDGSDKYETTIEQRVNTLEIKLFDFEYAIAKLQGNELQKPMLNSRFQRGSIHNIFPDDTTHPTLTTTSSQEFNFLSSPATTTHDVTFLSSPGESPPVSPENDELFRPQRASKATTATIRPYTARRRSPRSPSIHLSSERFETMMELIREEQAARQRLEEQMMELRREVESLRTPVFATIHDAYPTPSPESSHTTAPRSLHRAPAFQNTASKEISRFSGSEVDSDPGEIEGFEDVYETPLVESRKTFETARGSPGQVTV